jgi:glycosyltransferase involved in cell wall biosynthesis
MGTIRISVIIPTYNHGLFVEEAIRSVETLNRPDVEIIIVDDGSTDPFSIEVSKKLQEKGYQVFVRPNSGVAASRNFGIRQSKGEYIIPLDADNRLLLPYFNEGLSRLEDHPEIGVVFGDALIFGEKTGTWINHPLKPEEIIFENYIDNCAIYRKAAWESVGGYDENAPFHTREDWFFWLALLEKGWAFWHLNAFCFEYRFLENSKVRSRFSILKNRLIITEYIYPTQIRLLDAFALSGSFPEKKNRELKARLQEQLGRYHLRSGSISSGLRYLFTAMANDASKFKTFRTGVGSIIRRLGGSSKA